MPLVQLFVRVCAGYEAVTKPVTALFPPSGVRSKRQINTCANHFVGFRNLVQMSRLTAWVLHLQAAVFQLKVRWSTTDGFDLEFAT